MKILATLGLIGLIMTFLATSLSGSPLGALANDDIPSASDNVDGLDINTIHSVGNQLLSVYCSIVDDIASFQDDPSFERAEARYNEFDAYGKTLASGYQDLTSQLSQQFAQQTESAGEESSE